MVTRQVADSIATRIKDARVEAGLSREQVAVALGVSLSTVIRYETGPASRLSVDRLRELASITNRPLSFFLDEAAA